MYNIKCTLMSNLDRAQLCPNRTGLRPKRLNSYTVDVVPISRWRCTGQRLKQLGRRKRHALRVHVY